jgi:hypothetical protein
LRHLQQQKKVLLLAAPLQDCSACYLHLLLDSLLLPLLLLQTG